MARYVVTVVPISPDTRRRTGKARTMIVGTTHAEDAQPIMMRPKMVERRIEEESKGGYKVVDVREATDVVPNR